MEAIGIFAGGIAHDFNNILSPIFGFTQLALDNAPEGGKVREYLSEVLVAAKRALELVQQILTMSRQGERKQIRVQIHPLINETLNLLKAVLPATIEIRNNIYNCGYVLAGPSQIHQVVMNLCTNAYHAMQHQKGILELTLKEIETSGEKTLPDPEMRPGKYAKLTIRDTGCGMNREVMDRIFKPFFTTRKAGKGTGLGLSIVHDIVKSHQGYIKVFSEPDQGTTFDVYFPVIEEVESLVTEIPMTDLKGDEHILVVDDEDQIRRMIKNILERLGYQITLGESGANALEIFSNNPKNFDLVITDISMPKMTGVELAGKILDIRSDLPIILSTGFSESFAQEKAESIGARHIITKPPRRSDVAAIIRKVLDTP